VRVGDPLTEVADAARAALDALPRDGSGRVAVIAPAGRVAAYQAALRATDLADLLPGDSLSALDARLAVLAPRDTKGLEYDAVVLVEPASLGPADLYVAMTRPTRSLDLVTDGPLPAGLRPPG
jgi:DNA helicase IV